MLELVKENARSLGYLATREDRPCADEHIPDPLIVDQCEKLLGLVFGYSLACSNIDPGQPLVPDPEPIRSGIEIGWIDRVGSAGSGRSGGGGDRVRVDRLGSTGSPRSAGGRSGPSGSIDQVLLDRHAQRRGGAIRSGWID